MGKDASASELGIEMSEEVNAETSRSGSAVVVGWVSASVPKGSVNCDPECVAIVSELEPDVDVDVGGVVDSTTLTLSEFDDGVSVVGKNAVVVVVAVVVSSSFSF